MTEEKKVATEVIYEIKLELDEVLAYIRNMDLKYTLILDRLNKLVESTSKHVHSTSDHSDLIFPEHKASVSKPVSLKSKLQLALEQAEKDQEENVDLITKSNQDGKRRNVHQHSENQIRQIPTQQRFVYTDNKPIYMANVEVFDMEKNLIKQTKTNQVGKWLIPLVPGEYRVKVSKGSGPLKPKVEEEYLIVVPNQDSAVDLGIKTFSL